MVCPGPPLSAPWAGLAALGVLSSRAGGEGAVGLPPGLSLGLLGQTFTASHVSLLVSFHEVFRHFCNNSSLKSPSHVSSSKSTSGVGMCEVPARSLWFVGVFCVIVGFKSQKVNKQQLWMLSRESRGKGKLPPPKCYLAIWKIPGSLSSNLTCFAFLVVT